MNATNRNRCISDISDLRNKHGPLSVQLSVDISIEIGDAH